MNDAFVVTPMSQEFSLELGQTYTGTITVANPGSSTSDFAYKISVAPYSVLGEKYDADLATMSNHSIMVDWIKVEKPTGILKPNENAEINFTITVPSDAPAGGQYASLLVTEDVDAAINQGLKVNSVFEIASLVYANVAGETVEEGEILGSNIPGFVLSTPVNVGALITNTGNVHQTATTVLEVKDLITGQTILPTEENVGRYSEMIMPDTTRQTSYDIVGLPAVGVVEVRQTIYYNGTSMVKSENVVICPVWFMVLMMIAMIGIVGVVIMARKKRHKKHAIM